MSNVHGLRDDEKSDDEADDENNRFVGGIGDRGGGRFVLKLNCVKNTQNEQPKYRTTPMQYSA